MSVSGSSNLPISGVDAIVAGVNDAIDETPETTSSAPASGPLAFDPVAMPKLEKGSGEAQAVRSLQSALNVWRGRMGLRALGVDGLFGNGTKAALVHFQRAMGLPADGKVDAEDWQALKGTLRGYPPIRETFDTTGAPSFQPEAMQTVRHGSREYYPVSTLQKALNVWRKTHNQTPLGVDGIFGSGTRMAVLEFQRLNGLTPTGIVDGDTWQKLAQVETRALSTNDTPVDLGVPWISQFDRNGRVERPGGTACYRAAWAMLKEHMANKGIKATLLGNDDRIDVGRSETRTGDVLTTAEKAQQGRIYIDRCLDAGLPVLVGISHEGGNTYNTNAVTDHFILITGRGKDEQGRVYYTFNDPSTTTQDKGTGRLYPEDDGNLMKAGKTARGWVFERRWELSEIRTWKEIQ